MKRTLKTIIAAILAFVIASSSLSAFAFESGKDLLWDYYSEGVYEKYYYIGELNLGENDVKEENGETYNYYIFDAEKAGYYLFDYDSSVIDFMVTPEYMKKGRAVDIDRAVTDYRDEDGINYNTTMLYMDEGENIIGTYFCKKNETAVVTVEFMGEEITDIEFEENAFKDLVVDGDIHSMQDGKTHYIYLDAVIGFSSGKTLVYDGIYFDFTTEDAFPSGDTVLDLEFYEYKNKYPANICKITDFVSNVEFYGLDDNASGTVGYSYKSFYVPSADGFKVTYTDGRTEIIDVDENVGASAKIVLENGRVYTAFVSPVWDDNGDSYISVKVVGHTYEKVPFKVEKIPLATDLVFFFEGIGNFFNNKGAELGEAFNNVKDKSYTASDFFFNIYRLITVFFKISGEFISSFSAASAGFIRFHLTK